MERSRLKNIIILILVLVNLFLLGSLLLHRTEERAARTRMAQELTTLFAADGVTLDSSCIRSDAPPAGKVLARDSSAEAGMAALLLGENPTFSDEGGGIYTYCSDSGQAIFRSGGSFDITGRLISGDAETICRNFCKTYGYEDLSLSFSNGSGTATATQHYNGYPVRNASVTFLEEKGSLISVSGTHVPSAYSSEDTSASMTAPTALTKFLDARRKTGAVVSAVTDVYLCYELQSTNAAPLTLVPAWCIVTNTVNYYVNCSTGAVTHN